MYFVAESMQDAKQRMRSFREGLHRPFFAHCNHVNQTVQIDTVGIPEGEASFI